MPNPNPYGENTHALLIVNFNNRVAGLIATRRCGFSGFHGKFRCPAGNEASRLEARIIPESLPSTGMTDRREVARPSGFALPRRTSAAAVMPSWRGRNGANRLMTIHRASPLQILQRII
jgi:hypothetical protein